MLQSSVHKRGVCVLPNVHSCCICYCHCYNYYKCPPLLHSLQAECDRGRLERLPAMEREVATARDRGSWTLSSTNQLSLWLIPCSNHTHSHLHTHTLTLCIIIIPPVFYITCTSYTRKYYIQHFGGERRRVLHIYI